MPRPFGRFSIHIAGALLAWLLFSVPARCGVPDAVPASIRDFDHVAWTLKDGAPAGIWAIAQSTDGWLWLGTSSGLFRFDGVSFERHDLLPHASHRSRSVLGIYPMTSGDLWVTYSSGGASRRPANDPLHPTSPTGLPQGAPVDQIIGDGNGQVWATHGDDLYRFNGDTWIKQDRRTSGLPTGPWALVVDNAETVWAASDAGLWRRGAGDRRWNQAQVMDANGLPVLAPDGRLWLRQTQGFSLLAGPDAPITQPVHTSGVAESATDVIDAQGAWWSIVCIDGGVCRTTRPNVSTHARAKELLAADSFGESDGLSGISMTLLRDREGNLWVGTKNGLDRFRPRALTAVEFTEPAIYFALVPDLDGGLWIGTASRGFRDVWRRLDQRGITEFPGFNADTTAAYADRDGSILLGGEQGLWRFDRHRFVPIAIPVAQRGSRLQAITRDGAGRLWVAFRDFPVFRLEGEQWISKGGLNALPDLPPATAVTDPRGRVWFGYTANRLVILDGLHLRSFDETHGLNTGTVTAILPEENVTLIGGERGLCVFDGKVFRSLEVARPEVLTGITGVLRASDGTIWINGNAGAVRIEAAEFQRALTDPRHRMTYRLFDAADGMPGGAQQARPLPTLVETIDGRLWFAATNGLAWLDPARLRRNLRPPPLVIRSFASGASAYLPLDGLQLPPHARELRIGYSALELAMPDKIAFRYRLEGYDDGWQDPGTRREAFYTNLAPGHYRFRVIAANEDGVWNSEGASIAFDIAPTFVETRAFKVLCFAIALLMLWSFYRLRLAQSRRQLRQQIEARHGERERIARDLHDTLLQGVQGLLLRMQTWAVDTALPARHRADMTGAAAHAHEMLVEGRDRIIALRRSDAHRLGLAQTLRSIGEDYASIYPAEFSLTLHGEQRRLAAEAVEEMLDIAREALRNAFAHAGAEQIEARVEYARAAVTVLVLDDGCGIDDDVVHEGGRAGHWGLSGMRERAARLSAAITITHREPRGTQVKLVVPARMAYASAHRRRSKKAQTSDRDE
jgi:signal transduction histidine kinase/ligand-binding sensor domain-containing protein